MKGKNRKENILAAMNLISDDIAESLGAKKQIIIKPNGIDTNKSLACTHLDALRAVLNFLSHHLKWRGKIIIADGSGIGNSVIGFKRLGYFVLPKEYPQYKIEFVDLNIDKGIEMEIFDRELKPLKIKVAKTIFDAEWIISVCPPKTHDSVIVTLAIKNVVMGAPLKRFIFTSYKSLVHQGPGAMNKNLALMAKKLSSSLAIIDGWEGMEGNGPVDGSAVPWKIALASTDVLACDVLTSYLMGFEPDEIGYLHYLAAEKWKNKAGIEQISVLGEKNLRKFRKKFKPHATYEMQKKWKCPELSGLG